METADDLLSAALRIDPEAALNPRRAAWPACVAWVRERCEGPFRPSVVDAHRATPVLRWGRIPQDLQEELAAEALEVLGVRGVVPLRWSVERPWGWHGWLPRGGPCSCGGARSSCWDCEGTGTILRRTRMSRPPLPWVLALASDPAGVDAAEALVREAERRMSLWSDTKVPGPRRISWRVLAPKERRWSWRIWQPPGSWSRVEPAQWSQLVASGQRFPTHSAIPEVWRGRRMGDFYEAFVPFVALWNLGYRVEAFGDDGVDLAAPPLP